MSDTRVKNSAAEGNGGVRAFSRIISLLVPGNFPVRRRKNPCSGARESSAAAAQLLAIA
jgi:hypothetical protein